MLKVAILDDYQNVSQQFVDIEKLSGKYEFKIFSEAFADEADAIEQLSDFEALLIMRERTPITKNLIDNLTKLKFVITSGLRNRSIDLETAKKRKNRDSRITPFIIIRYTRQARANLIQMLSSWGKIKLIIHNEIRFFSIANCFAREHWRHQG